MLIHYAQDRVYVGKAGVPEIYDLGLELFRDTVIFSTAFPIHTHLYTTLLVQIQIEREGSVINRSAIKSNIDMLTALSAPSSAGSGRLASSASSSRPSSSKSVYQTDFEPAFLATSTEFYRAEATRLLDARDAGAYLRHVERRFIEEAGRVAVYLHNSTDTPLRVLLEAELLARHLQTIIDMPGSGLVTMLDEGRHEDLTRLYSLFKRVTEGLPTLKAAVKAYVASTGKQINLQVASQASAPPSAATASARSDGPTVDGDGSAKATGSKPTTAREAASDQNAASTPQAAMALKWVEDVLAFKHKFDYVLKHCFNDDKSCETAINEVSAAHVLQRRVADCIAQAFETFVNSNARAPEFISLFIDENLKKGLKGKTEEEVDDVLNRTIIVFRFLHEKDTFERYYKGHLTKRLLQGRSVSDDAERGMMAKLKIECGHGYVQKLQGMLNDMKVSEDTMGEFAESIQRSQRVSGVRVRRPAATER